VLLIGQYDSPFVRRVAVALRLYGVAYEHAPWSTFGDADRIAKFNPLRRVPTVVFDDGFSLMDSGSILEIIDAGLGEGAFLDRPGKERRELLRLCALAGGVADKGVSLLYEKAFREGLPMWVQRCRTQVGEGLDALEVERAARTTPWLFGDTISHADILLATMYRFIAEALDGAFEMEGYAALTAHATACEALPEFSAVYQPYSLTRPPEPADA
jgi:glutathione S-transferase